MKQILAATANHNKLAELRSVAERFGIVVENPEDVRAGRGLGALPDVEENGATYLENALLKAKAFFEWSGGLPSLGDDSGLEVEALGGAPGINSKRYAAGSDQKRIDKLLGELNAYEKRTGTVNRNAAFCCTLVLLTAEEQMIAATFRLEGSILYEPRGERGFGYDPIVYLPSIGATLAEVEFAAVCRQGFRARAAEQLFEKLQSLPGTA